MAYTQAQIDAEIQRKAKLGIPRNYGADPAPAQTAAQAQAAPGQQLLSQNPMAAPAAMQMQRYGVDPSLFGPNVTRNQAYANAGTLGTPTADVQKSLFSTLMSTAGAYGAMPTGTAAQAANLPLYNGISGYLKGLEGQQFQSTIVHNDQMQNARNSNSLGWANNTLAQQDNVLARDKFTSDQDQATANAIWAADALSPNLDTEEKAYDWVATNAVAMGLDKVNPAVIRQMIHEKFNTGSGAGAGQDMVSIRQKAQQMAQKQIDAINADNQAKQAAGALPAAMNGTQIQLTPVPSLMDATTYWINYLTGQQ